MSLLSLKALLDKAQEGSFGIGAFNVSDTLQAEAVLEAAADAHAPVIVQTIAGASAHGSDERFWNLLHTLIASYSEVPVALHLDHGRTIDDCRRAVDSGFTSVMIDGSVNPDTHEPATFDANVALTRSVVAFAHPAGVSVEGELGTIGGTETGEQSAKIVLATPDEATLFVQATQVDALAVAIGTSHGAYKFMTPPDSSVLHVDLVGEIAAAVPQTHLVMHGSSSLPEQYRSIINSFGGSLPVSWGVPDDEKPRAISMGIRKVNQGMDSHLAFTAGVRKHLAHEGMDVDPATYLNPGREAMFNIVRARMDLFGQTGQSHRYAG